MAPIKIASEPQNLSLQVTKCFKVFDTVEIFCYGGRCIRGKIIYLEADKVYVTAPYEPIRETNIKDIKDILLWSAPWE